MRRGARLSRRISARRDSSARSGPRRQRSSHVLRATFASRGSRTVLRTLAPLALFRLAARPLAAQALSAAISLLAAFRPRRFRARRATFARALRAGRRRPPARAATTVSLANRRAQSTPAPPAPSPPGGRRTHPRHPVSRARPGRVSLSGARRTSRISVPLATFVPQRRWRRRHKLCALRATFVSPARRSEPRTRVPLGRTAHQAQARP